MNSRVKIIAEIGVNHNGSMSIAKKLIRQLSKLDIDFIKFQIADPNSVYSKDAFKAEYQKLYDKEKKIIEMSRKLQLTKKQHLELSNYCKKHRKKYACTAFDLKNLKFLIKKIKIPFIKIPSGEILSYDILKFVSKQSKKIILSTGMASFEEIEKAIKILNSNKKKNLTILHCTSTYPAKENYINLNVIDTLRKKFNLPVGYSDHSISDDVLIGAIAKGAKIVEKHVTLSNSLKGPDHKSSITIAKFKKLVKKIRNFEIILGSYKKKISKEENKIKLMARKSIVAKKFIRAKKKITLQDICFKRPGTGISPINFRKVVGKISKRDIAKDRVIRKNFI